MKKNSNNKTFILAVSFILILSLCAGIFAIEYTSVVKENQKLSSSVRKADNQNKVLLSQNSDLQQKNGALSSELSNLNSQVASQNQQISELNSALSQTQGELSSSESKINSINSSVTASKVTDASAGNLKIDTSNLSSPNIGNKVCYLTFDDGPSDNTLKILDILKTANAKATFFVINSSHFSYVKNIDSAGHTVALHTDTHNFSYVYKSTTNYYKDLEAIKSRVKSQIGKDVNIIRFPGGSSNGVSAQYCKGIMTKLTKDKTQSVESKGYKYFDWNVDSGDAEKNNVPANTIINNVVTNSKNKDDICLLMHDTGAKGTTVEALPKIICYLRSQGYRFEALEEDSPIFHHNVYN